MEQIESVLQEAERLTTQERKDEYGSCKTDFARIALMWAAILNFPVSANQVALCMIALKISRELNCHKRDNLVDIAGYTNCLAMLTGEKFNAKD